uniref:Uncharacterized protein n=1 Tax=Arundo donax TaxID=35708 RepID=A0A0A9C4C6_ARUDO
MFLKANSSSIKRDRGETLDHKNVGLHTDYRADKSLESSIIQIISLPCSSLAQLHIRVP